MKFYLILNLKQIRESLLWSRYPKYIIEILKQITIKQKPKHLLISDKYLPNKQIYFGFQYINESSVKFVPNVSNLISKTFNFIKCIPYFKNDEIFSHIFRQKLTVIATYLNNFIQIIFLNKKLFKKQ